MKINRRRYESGAISGALISVILLSLVALLLVGLSVWLYLQYNTQKTTADSRIGVAVANGKRTQAENDEKKFADREKEPNREFVGPDDYGRLTFSYPKTWSVYVAKDISQGGDFQAYLNPVTVPPVGKSDQRFALRVLIQNQDYDTVVQSYDDRVKSGDLKSSSTSANGQSGTRLDGKFSTDIRGAVVIYKVRDKTVSIFTDADTFKPDFENIVKTIKFNQ